MNGSAMADGLMQDESKYPPTYFAHPGHSTAIWAHIILMTLAYVFALPLGELAPAALLPQTCQAFAGEGRC